MESETYQALLTGLRQGDEQAAKQLFQQNVGPLIVLAQAHLSLKLRRKVDAEDVVQSAFLSFFRRVRGGEYTLDEVGDLWRLLATITLNKVRRQAEHFSTQKRSLSLEQSASSELSGPPPFRSAALDAAQLPECRALLMELLDQLTAPLDETQRQIVQMRLLGYTLEEIAAELSRSERTVRRVLDKLKSHLRTLVDEPEQEG